jgi:hypothetical protein
VKPMNPLWLLVVLFAPAAWALPPVFENGNVSCIGVPDSGWYCESAKGSGDADGMASRVWADCSISTKKGGGSCSLYPMNAARDVVDAAWDAYEWAKKKWEEWNGPEEERPPEPRPPKIPKKKRR